MAPNWSPRPHSQALLARGAKHPGKKSPKVNPGLSFTRPSTEGQDIGTWNNGKHLLVASRAQVTISPSAYCHT